MFSRTVEYAFRAITLIAMRAPEPCTTDDLSRATGAPRAYLSKVLQALRRAGVLKSQRGLHGGMTLSREPGAVTLLDIKNGVDAYAPISVCPFGDRSQAAQICRLHRRINETMLLVEQELAKTTLADLLGSETADIALCERL